MYLQGQYVAFGGELKGSRTTCQCVDMRRLPHFGQPEETLPNGSRSTAVPLLLVLQDPLQGLSQVMRDAAGLLQAFR